MSTHTAGPWSIRPLLGTDVIGAYDVIGGDGDTLLETAWPVRDDATNEANLALIAAAPALLAAASELLLTHAADRSEAGEGACDCDACALLRPLVEAVGS